MYPCYGRERSEYGWEKVEGMWCPTWYHVSSLPEKLDGGVPEQDEEEDEEVDGAWSERSELRLYK